VRQSIIEELREEGTVLLDFEGIEVITPSFADELFGGLLAQVGAECLSEGVSVANAAPEVAGWIRHALARQSRQIRKQTA